MRKPEALTELQELLGVEFQDKLLLEKALRHRSRLLDQPLECNERLEFLGDSIVGLTICDYLFQHYPESSEGELARAKSYLASEQILASAALDIHLDRAIEMSESEETTGGRGRKSILSDSFEALIAAIYLDQGIRAARRATRQALKPYFQKVAKDNYRNDFKSMLQEKIQAKRRRTPRYRIAEETGAAHEKSFHAHALLGNHIIGEGDGMSKKEAEQAAAKDALSKMAVQE